MKGEERGEENMKGMRDGGVSICHGKMLASHLDSAV